MWAIFRRGAWSYAWVIPGWRDRGKTSSQYLILPYPDSNDASHLLLWSRSKCPASVVAGKEVGCMERAGKDFDPKVVEAFVTAFRKGGMEVPDVVV